MSVARPPSVWLSILMRVQGGRCFHCEVEMLELPGRGPQPHTRALPDNHPTVEHLHPSSTTGKHLLNNTVLACHACNRDRRNAPPTPDMITKATVVYGLLGLVPFVHSRTQKKIVASQQRIIAKLLTAQQAIRSSRFGIPVGKRASLLSPD